MVVYVVDHCTPARVHSEYGIMTTFHSHWDQISVNAFLAPSGINRHIIRLKGEANKNLISYLSVDFVFIARA